MENNTIEITMNGVTVNAKKANNVLKWLILQEAENVRTKTRNDVQMIKDIQKRIEEEAECY
jgi:hypothetical protein